MVKRSLALAVALALPLAVLAQAYPGRPITLVVPYTPGTGIDIIARTVGPKLSERWKEAVIVDNKPRASGNIGGATAAKAPPAGDTPMGTGNTLTPTPALYKSLPYAPATHSPP